MNEPLDGRTDFAVNILPRPPGLDPYSKASSPPILSYTRYQYECGDYGGSDDVWEYVRDVEGRYFCSLTALRAFYEDTTAAPAPDLVMRRLLVLYQKKALYVAVRDVPYLLCPEDSTPKVHMRFTSSEYDGDQNTDHLNDVAFCCATCALLTAPPGARLSIKMGLDTEEAHEIMNYEDDDGEEASSFSADRQYYLNRTRASTDSEHRPDDLTRRMIGMFGDSESFNDHFPLVRKLLVRPVVAALLVTTTARGADGSPMATVVTRQDGILLWMGWKSIWATS